MMEVEVSLHFTCCLCGEPVTARVICSGEGLKAGPRTVAAVAIPCPECNLSNQLYFEPSGNIRSVVPHRGLYQIPEPSVN